MPRFLTVLLLLILVTLSAAPTPPPAPDAAYPGSMAALGDSITQAYNACCGPGNQAAQSWSTGSGPSDGITSHYERLLQFTSAIQGSNFNNSVSGAKASDLPRQAAEAVGQGAEYVTMLVGANDLCTPSVEAMTPVEDFRSHVTQALAAMDGMRPRGRIFVSSIPNIYQLWSVLHQEPAARSAWSAARTCQSMLAASNTEEMRQLVVQRQAAFNAVLAEICAQYRNCRSDGGAVYSYAFSAAELSTLDYFHPGVQGQAKLADITWDAAW
jgi:lysophospholipase L1-like esterase